MDLDVDWVDLRYITVSTSSARCAWTVSTTRWLIAALVHWKCRKKIAVLDESPPTEIWLATRSCDAPDDLDDVDEQVNSKNIYIIIEWRYILQRFWSTKSSDCSRPFGSRICAIRWWKPTNAETIKSRVSSVSYDGKSPYFERSMPTLISVTAIPASRLSYELRPA